MTDLSPWQREALRRLYTSRYGPHLSDKDLVERAPRGPVTRRLEALGLIETIYHVPFRVYALTEAGRAECARRWPEAVAS